MIKKKEMYDKVTKWRDDQMNPFQSKKDQVWGCLGFFFSFGDSQRKKHLPFFSFFVRLRYP